MSSSATARPPDERIDKLEVALRRLLCSIKHGTDPEQLKRVAGQIEADLVKAK